MSYNLEGDDYLELWKYFEDRADNVKEAMFTSVTWALGFSAAVFGFIFTTLFEMKEMTLSDPKLKSPVAVLLASVIGLLLCAYSVILVRESKKHILANWERAKRCRRSVCGIDYISPEPDEDRPSDYSLRYVWNRVLGVIVFFASGFYGLLVLALANLRTW